MRKWKAWLSAAVSIVMCAIPAPIQTWAAPAGTDPEVEDAILYQINDGKLEYNVTHSAQLSDEVKISGCDIDSVDELAQVMGTVDAPEPVCSLDHSQRKIGKAVHADLEMDGSGRIAEVNVTKVSKRPVIGISWKKDAVGSDYRGFAEAFERNGAMAVFVPQVMDAEGAEDTLEQLDGLFETGGEDWNPSLYNQKQTPHGAARWNDARDTSDINLMQKAVEMNVPLLCVCRGEQGFNVAMGGGLIQDIPYYFGQKVLDGSISAGRVTKVLSGRLPGSDNVVKDTGYSKYNEETGEFVRTYDQATDTYTDPECAGDGHLRVWIDGITHSGGTGYHELNKGTDGIGISENSKWLYDIFKTNHIETVATAHHQAVDPDKLGEGVSIAAMSGDGIVEAIEYPANDFCLALQWHPERDALRDTRGVDVDQDLCNAPLRALVDHAADKMDNGEDIPEEEDSVNVQRIEISHLPDKTVYKKGEKLNLDGLKITGYISAQPASGSDLVKASDSDLNKASDSDLQGKEKKVDIPVTSCDIDVSAFDADHPGKYSIIVKYAARQSDGSVKNLETSFAVEVTDAAAENGGNSQGGHHSGGGGGGGSSSGSHHSGGVSSGIITRPGSWKQNQKGWWYEHTDGSYSMNAWEMVGGKWYHFDASGYMQIGWIVDGGSWYRLAADGAMLTGWQKVSDIWYYLNAVSAQPTYDYDAATGTWHRNGNTNKPFGAMYAGEKTPDGYTVDTSGAWVN